MDETALEADGWKRLQTHRFSAVVGSSWMRQGADGLEVAVLTAEGTANENLGIVHGGALMTIADIAFGCAAGTALGGDAPFVTVQMQYYFTAAVPVGSLVTCKPEVVRRTSQLVFVRGVFMVGERTIGSGDGLFKVLDVGKADAMRAG